jgi:hypothetical protein
LVIAGLAITISLCLFAIGGLLLAADLSLRLLTKDESGLVQ